MIGIETNSTSGKDVANEELDAVSTADVVDFDVENPLDVHDPPLQERTFHSGSEAGVSWLGSSSRLGSSQGSTLSIWIGLRAINACNASVTSRMVPKRVLSRICSSCIQVCTMSDTGTFLLIAEIPADCLTDCPGTQTREPSSFQVSSATDWQWQRRGGQGQG